MIVDWLHQYIPGRPAIMADQSALLASNPDLFWLWVAVACIVLLVALAQQDRVAFWCFGVLAACITLMGATRRAAWDGLLGDVMLIAMVGAGVVFMADRSNKQRKLTGAGGLGGMWGFALLIVGLAAVWLLSTGGG